MNTKLVKITGLATVLLFLPVVHGHGRMIDPASRASSWRYLRSWARNQLQIKAEDNPTFWHHLKPSDMKPYYDDNQLSCGGADTQWSKHAGKCGVCGDEFGKQNPLFAGDGEYAENAPIVREYKEGQIITVTIEITANHLGYFAFRVAPLVNPPIMQKELDKTILKTPDGRTKWDLGSSVGYIGVELQLPVGLHCQHCVLQWNYTAGNNYQGKNAETFINCADIRIVADDAPQQASLPPLPEQITTTATGTTTVAEPSNSPPCNCPAPPIAVYPTPEPCPKPEPCPQPTTCPSPKPCFTPGTCKGTIAVFDSFCKARCANLEPEKCIEKFPHHCTCEPYCP